MQRNSVNGRQHLAVSNATDFFKTPAQAPKMIQKMHTVNTGPLSDMDASSSTSKEIIEGGIESGLSLFESNEIGAPLQPSSVFVKKGCHAVSHVGSMHTNASNSDYDLSNLDAHGIMNACLMKSDGNSYLETKENVGYLEDEYLEDDEEIMSALKC